MYNSYCPKCKSFLTPDIHKCTSCGFNRKKYYEQNYYIPEKQKEKSIAKPESVKGLSIFWIMRIFIFPFSYFWLFIGNYNSKQIFQGAIVFILYFVFIIILFVMFPAEMAYFLDLAVRRRY